MPTTALDFTQDTLFSVLGPIAKFQCTAWLGVAWVAGRRRRARDFAGKILE